MLKVNEYFEGRVKSIGIEAEGYPATIGAIESGSYEFGTSSVEIMKVIAGSLEARLPGGDFKAYGAGESFEVPKGVRFEVRAAAICAYLCIYK